MRVALIGVSHWHTRFFLDPLRALPEVQIVGAGEAGAADELCDRARPDFVFALGRHCDMAATARTLIERRIPFAMEKPCGLNAAEVEDLAARATSAGLFAAVPFVFRQGRMRETIERVAARENLLYLSFKFVAGGVERYREAGCSWMLHRGESGGGCLLNLGVHFVDLFRVMAAPAEPVVVAATMSNALAKLDIEDHAVVVLRAREATCLVETGYFFPAPTDRFDMRFSIRTERHHFIAPDRDTLEIFDAGGGVERVSMPTTNVPYYAAFVRDVLRRVVAGEPPVAGLADMAAAMRLIETAYAMAPLPGATDMKKGLLLVMIGIDRAHEEELNRWYDEEHFPERMACSGFLNGRRFTAVQGAPKYLAIYDLETPGVLQSEAYQKIAGRTPWTERLSAHFDPIVRSVYVEIRAPVTSGPKHTGNGFLLVAIDVDPRHEAELNHWYDDEHIAERMAIPGFLRARRFVALEGKPKYLALYDLESPAVLDSAAYRHAAGHAATELTRHMQTLFKPMIRNVYLQIRHHDAA